MASPSFVRPAKPAGTDFNPVVSAVLLLVSVVFAYFPVLHGGFLWDDDAHVTKLALRSLHGLERIWFELGATQQYYPVLHSAFWIEHRLWGDAVLGYHLTNLAFHVTAAWLLALVLRRLDFPAPWLAALIFALHPIGVESVAWISEQKNTLSAAFYLGAALLYLHFDETRRRRWYFLSLGLFVLALLTKSVTASLPAALLVVFWWRRGRLEWKRDVQPLVPWLVIGAASGLFTAWVEQRFIGAEGADFSFTAVQRVLLAGRVIVFYFSKLIWPVDLMFIYPRWSVDAAAVWQYLFPVGSVLFLAALVYYARTRRGPLAGFLFFAGTLFPVLGFVNVYPFVFSFVADHFQYLASLGIIVPCAWGLAQLAGRLPLPAAGRAALLFVVPAVLGFLSWQQSRIYRNADTLNRATLDKNPAAWLAHYNLAVSLGQSPGGLTDAIAEYRETIRLKPDHWAAHNNLAGALLKVPDRTAEAIAEYETALRLNPNFAEAHNNLGIVLGHQPGRLAEAVAQVRLALKIRPDYDGAHNNLGALLTRQPGSQNGAISEFRAALRLAPDNAEYHYNLANALAGAPDQLAEAVAEYQAALKLRPDYMEAHANLGAAWARLPGHASDAIAEDEAAIRLAPDNAQVRTNLAHVLARTPGHQSEAVAAYVAAVRLDPVNADIHNDFGVLLSELPGRLPEATAEFETALRLRPDFAEAHFCLGVVLLKTGHHQKDAIEHLRKALEIRPDFEPARKVLEQLKATAH